MGVGYLPWAVPVRDMAVDVERALRADVAYHSGEIFDIHAVFKRHGSEGVAQLVAR